MLNTSLSPWPSFTQEEADAVSKVLLSNKVNYWTGTECREFEKEFANEATDSSGKTRFFFKCINVKNGAI